MKKSNYLVCLVATALAVPFAAANAGDHVSSEPAYNWWDNTTPVGTTKVVRSPNGISAVFKTSGLPAGHVMTLWIMFFDNPSACAASPGPCTLADAGNPATGFDFHYAGGHIVNGNKSTISGHLRVGELSTSGWAEVGETGLVSPLTNPLTAEVILAIHSHGPAATGQLLKAQASSYLGGCDLFLGPGGFAANAGDVPVNPGECSTIQNSAHLP